MQGKEMEVQTSTEDFPPLAFDSFFNQKLDGPKSLLPSIYNSKTPTRISFEVKNRFLYSSSPYIDDTNRDLSPTPASKGSKFLNHAPLSTKNSLYNLLAEVRSRNTEEICRF